MRPPRPAPSKPGKNKGAGLGFRSGVVPALSVRVSSPVSIGGLQMQPTNLKRYYSPQLSALASISVRRLSWAMGLSMPAAINIMVRLMPSIVNPSKVCDLCKDKTKCQSCSFLNQPTPQQPQEVFSQFTQKEQNALEAVF